MSFETNSPNMNLVLPGVGSTLGPTWASDLNASLTILDQHNHGPGSGVQITPTGLNINADLTFNNNNLVAARSLRLQPQTAAPGLPSDVGCLYELGVDLFYTDGNGANIRITQSGGVAGSPGSISGLVSPASAAYVAASSTFVWQSGANLAANLDAGNLILRNSTVSSHGLTLEAPAALGSDYTLILPALPAVQSFMTLDNAGNMAAPWTVDNTTIKVVGNQLVVQQPALTATYQQHQFEANGPYSVAAMPQSAIDGPMFFNTNATILAVWIYSGTAGSAGTTEFDVKVASPGGSFASILSTTGKITSAAASGVWTDSNTVVGALTGVTKPVVSAPSVSAGQALRFDILQTMTGASDAVLIIHYISR